jgi:gas vesicle protein
MAKSGSKMLLAGILGLTAGIAIGVLYAPAKGTKTRKRLKKKIMNMADVMQDDISDKLSALKTVFSGMEEDAEENEEVRARES